MPDMYDVAVVGAGPTGLSAAIYTTREDLKTIVLESAVVGGLIATTELVDNYPGFPDGVGGIELSDAMERQAKRFGAEVRTGATVEQITGQDGVFELRLAAGRPVRARTVLVATGSSYRKLGIPGEIELTGKGVHYCATCDGPLYRGKDLVIIGGGNTAMQEGLFLTKFAKSLTVLVRGPRLRAAEVLVEQMQAKANVIIHYNTVATAIKALDGRVRSLSIIDSVTGKTQDLTTDGVFVFVGLLPNTGWLNGAIKLDYRGFVQLSDQFQTSMPGVFAAGDVQVGASGQVATAVGEGVGAALSMRRYLDQ